MDPVRMTLADARAMLEEHFGAASVPAKHLRLLDWWRRLLADPDAPVHWQRARAPAAGTHLPDDLCARRR